MLHFTLARKLGIIAACLVAILFTLPNFFDKEALKNVPPLFRHQLAMGLDLRGGAHLLLAMDANDIRKDWLANLREDARRVLRDAKIGFAGLGVAGNSVQVRLAKPEDVDAALKELRNKVVQTIGSRVLGSSGTDVEVEKVEGGVITITPTEQGIQHRIGNAGAAAIEVVRRRVDPGGNVEANIVRQGRDRILVQVPGFDDTKILKDRIGQTAKLTFHEVHATMSAEDAKQGRPPAGFKVYPGEDKKEGYSYLLRETPVVDGADLTDAQPGFDQRTQEPIITFRFNQSAARKFGKFTSENVGRPFAIVLDDKVLSAPVIREPILGGSGQISGSFTTESANSLAVQLRSGALPTKLTVVEERTVGPSLGQDSIEAGKISALVGTVLVTVFMILAYGLFGVFAMIAVIPHMAMIVALMSLLGSTLTLPGIAGLVLTVGMAVDANVLIYERMREELRNGKPTISAIEAGFSRAYATIVDSNLTTLIAGIVMFWLGSGPVRGFAVTLSLGILTTVFTAFTVTRLLVYWWVSAHKSRKIPAPL